MKDIIVEPEQIREAARQKKAEKKVEEKSAKKRSCGQLALWALALTVWVGVALFGVQLLVALIFRAILPASALVTNHVQAIYSVVAYGLSMAVIIFVPWGILKIKTTRDELGLRGLPTWTDVLLAPVGFIATTVVTMAVMAVMMALLPNIDWQQAQDVGFKGLFRFHEFVMAFVCLVVLAPLCEEIIFRGWLYGKLRARMSAVPAIILVSVLFGIMHGQWNVGVTVFVMSVGMCVMRELTGTVWAGVILHIIKNGLAFFVLLTTAGL